MTLRESDMSKIIMLQTRTIPTMLARFKKERDHYRVLGNESMFQALKVMMNSINSIHGLFGPYGSFEFQD